jgi:Subunit 21 of Mediator complex
MSTSGTADIVTQIQDHLNGLLSSFFNFTGALQRDAPPVTVKGEPAIRNSNQIDMGAPEQTVFMAKQVAEQCKLLEELIIKLPDLALSETQQLEAIAAIQLDNDEEGSSLGIEIGRAAKELSAIQNLFGVLADSKLSSNDTANPDLGSFNKI